MHSVWKISPKSLIVVLLSKEVLEIGSQRRHFCYFQTLFYVIMHCWLHQIQISYCGLLHWRQYRRGKIPMLRHLWWSIRPWASNGNGARLGILSKALRKVSILSTTVFGVSRGYRLLVCIFGLTSVHWSVEVPNQIYFTLHILILRILLEATSIVTVVGNQIQVVSTDTQCILNTTNLPAEYRGHSLNAYNNVLYLCGGQEYYGKECLKFDLANSAIGNYFSVCIQICILHYFLAFKVGKSCLNWTNP